MNRAPTSGRTIRVALPKDPVPPPDRRPRIVPVFLPHAGCPHQCVFCNQQTITGCRRAPAPDDLRRSAARYLGRRPRDPGGVQLAFYGGNFLGQSPTRIHRLLAAATGLVREGWIGSIRFSTRPETVDDRRLEAIAPFPVATVELGAQSMNDRVLAASHRGHTAADTADAARRLQAAGYRVGLQMMIGLPGDDAAGTLESGRRIAALAPDLVRIYPCLVLAGSPLAGDYTRGRYRPLPLEAAVEITRRLWTLFARRRIPVIRMGLQATADLVPGDSILAGPYHPAFGHLVHSAVCRAVLAETFEREAAQGFRVTVTAHPRQVSRVRGQANANLATLQDRFRLTGLFVRGDDRLPVHRLQVAMTRAAPRTAAILPTAKGAMPCVVSGR